MTNLIRSGGGNPTLFFELSSGHCLGLVHVCEGEFNPGGVRQPHLSLSLNTPSPFLPLPANLTLAGITYFCAPRLVVISSCEHHARYISLGSLDCEPVTWIIPMQVFMWGWVETDLDYRIGMGQVGML